MRFLRYIDRKFTVYDQKAYIMSFIFFGIPLGYSFAQIINILISGWDKYHFSVYNLIGNIVTNFLILLPFLINYIRHTRKFNKICEKIDQNPNTKYKVKALYDYQTFTKGLSYEISKDSVFMNFDKHNIFIIDSGTGTWNKSYPLKNIINKFELDDIKEDRLRKLKKLKKIW